MTLAGAALIAMPSPACAQLGAAVSLNSDDRFRGYSVSDGHPVGLLDISYDLSNGLYASASGSVVFGAAKGIHPLALQLNAGYARRLGAGLSMDVGVVHSAYSHYSGLSDGRSYTEVYAGVAGKLVSSRFYFSPHYFEGGAKTLYGEIEGHVSPAAKLTLNGHAGLLVPLNASEEGQGYRTDYDWRLGVATSAGPVSLHADWVNGPPRYERYETRRHNAFVVGLSAAL